MKSTHMKAKNYLLYALTFAVFSSTFAVKAAEDIDNVTMNISTKETQRGHRIHMRAHEKVIAYMIKNGDITQEEINERKRKRKLQREELKSLKKSGDINAYKARLAEIKEQHKMQRKALEEYIRNNDELKQDLREQRHERRERIRDNMRERRKEKLVERQEHRRATKHN